MLPEARFVLEPDFDALVGMGLTDLLELRRRFFLVLPGSPWVTAETKGIYRMVATGMLWYPGLVVLEDRATLGSDPSAKTGPNGMGGKPLTFQGLSPFSVMPEAQSDKSNSVPGASARDPAPGQGDHESPDFHPRQTRKDQIKEVVR